MFISKSLPRLLLPYVSDRKDSYGKDPSIGLRDPSSPDLGRKKLVVDFSSPNIGSEFHGKHLRSTILGAYIANWDVVQANYLGDRGKQIGLLGADGRGLAWKSSSRLTPSATCSVCTTKSTNSFGPSYPPSGSHEIAEEIPLQLKPRGSLRRETPSRGWKTVMRRPSHCGSA